MDTNRLILVASVIIVMLGVLIWMY